MPIDLRHDDDPRARFHDRALAGEFGETVRIEAEIAHVEAEVSDIRRSAPLSVSEMVAERDRELERLREQLAKAGAA